MKLIYRCDRKGDELLEDYIGRLAYFNGFSDIRKFRTKVKLNYSVGCEIFVKQIGFLTGNKIDFSLDREYSERLGNFGGLKICPMCFVNEPHIRWYWRFRRLSHCQVHNLYLVGYENSFQCYLEPKSTFIDPYFVYDALEQFYIHEYCIKVESVRCTLENISKFDFKICFVNSVGSFYIENFGIELNVIQTIESIKEGLFINMSVYETMDRLTAYLARNSCVGIDHIVTVSNILMFEEYSGFYNFDASKEAMYWAFDKMNAAEKFQKIMVSGSMAVFLKSFKQLFDGYDEISDHGNQRLTNILIRIRLSTLFSICATA